MSDQKAWTDTIHEWTEEFADNDPVSYRLDRAGDLYALSDRWRYANDDSPSGRELARMILADRAAHAAAQAQRVDEYKREWESCCERERARWEEQKLLAQRVAELERALIPDYLELAPGQYALIVHDIPGTLAHFQLRDPYQEKGYEIVAQIGLPDSSAATYEQRLHLLIHELLHGAAEMLKQAGVIRRQPDEAFITNVAGPLLYALGVNGLLRGVEPEALRAAARRALGGEQEEGK